MDKETIRSIRQSIFLTQQEFAQKLDVSLAIVQKWEGGIHKPRPRNVKKLILVAEEAKELYSTQ